MKEADLYRLVGLIDADGGIRLERKGIKKYGYPCIYIHSTSIEIINWLLLNIGGSKTNKKKRKEFHNDIYVWKIRGKKAIDLCGILYPFLLEKSKQERASLIYKEYLNLTPRNGKYTKDQEQRKRIFENKVSNALTRASNNKRKSDLSKTIVTAGQCCASPPYGDETEIEHR